MRSLEDVVKDIRNTSESIAEQENILADRIPVKELSRIISELKAERKAVEHELVMIAQSGTEASDE